MNTETTETLSPRTEAPTPNRTALLAKMHDRLFKSLQAPLIMPPCLYLPWTIRPVYDLQSNSTASRHDVVKVLAGWPDETIEVEMTQHKEATLHIFAEQLLDVYFGQIATAFAQAIASDAHAFMAGRTRQAVMISRVVAEPVRPDAVVSVYTDLTTGISLKLSEYNSNYTVEILYGFAILPL